MDPRRSLLAVSLVTAALGLVPATASAAGMPEGTYRCFYFKKGETNTQYPGRFIKILSSKTYRYGSADSSTAGKYVRNGKKVRFTSGKLKNRKATYSRNFAGQRVISVQIKKDLLYSCAR